MERGQNDIYITKSCFVADNKVMVNNSLDHMFNSELSFVKFLKAVYKYYNIKYPKFYKMDMLSKLGFVSSEILLKDEQLKNNYKESEIGVILCNSSSSIDIDKSFQNTLEDKSNYFPSPALFVYTLANIMAGEISIRNKFKGENSVFIDKGFPLYFLKDYVSLLFETNKIKACITGWVEANAENYESFLLLVKRKPDIENEGSLMNEFVSENILELYNRKR